jgi:hypothetical protein
MTGVILAYSRNTGLFVQAGIVIFLEWPKQLWTTKIRDWRSVTFTLSPCHPFTRRRPSGCA